MYRRAIIVGATLEKVDVYDYIGPHCKILERPRWSVTLHIRTESHLILCLDLAPNVIAAMLEDREGKPRPGWQQRMYYAKPITLQNRLHKTALLQVSFTEGYFSRSCKQIDRILDELRKAEASQHD